MYSSKQIILLTIVIVSALQTAFAINCYDCSANGNCDPPQIVTCDQAAAKRTEEDLWKYFSGVPFPNGTEFKCTAVNITMMDEPETIVRRIYGCVHREVDVCGLEMNPIVGRYESDCRTCSTDLCNSQIPSALKCYECNGVSSCDKPSEVTCSETTANRTSNTLKATFSNVVEMKTSNFDCLSMNFTVNNQVTNKLHGCVYRELNTCSLTLMTNSGYNSSQCRVCSGDLCNKNPAGKATISFFTVFASVLAVIVVKAIA